MAKAYKHLKSVKNNIYNFNGVVQEIKCNTIYQDSL